MVRITLLGEQSVVDPVTERTLTQSARSIALLGLLISRTGAPQSRSAIAGAFWPDSSERQALTNLRRELHDLRHLIDDDSLEVTPSHLCWHDRGRHRVDLGTFLHEHAAALGAPDDDAVVRHGTAALAAYGGDLLPGLDGDWLGDARTRLRTSCVELCDLVSAAAERNQRLDVAADAMRKRISLDPYDEPAHRRLMELQAAHGDRAGALRTYQRLTRLLELDLGVAPDPVTARTLAGITAPAAALDASPAAADASPEAAAGSPEAADAPGEREPGRARRRTRLGALTASIAVVAALAGGATIQGGDPATAAAVPANAVTELDASGTVVASTPVGTNPVALASSKGALWVVNAGDDTVSRIDLPTHTVTQTVAVGHAPRALAVTGDDIWVTNFSDGTVSRINATAGRTVDRIRVGHGPDAIAAGPAGLWVANSLDNTIQRIDTTTGLPARPVNVDDGPDGLTVDDTSVWVAHARSGSVMRIDADTGDQLLPLTRVGSGPRGIVRLGNDVWVADELSQSVTRITVDTGHTHTIDVGDGPTAIAAHAGSVWVADRYSGDLVRIDPRTEARERIDLRTAVNGVAVADDRLWVASGAFASTSHRGGTLRVAATELPGRYGGVKDPARTYDVWTSQALRVVYDGLLAFHYSGADPQVLVPDLALAVPEPTDDGTTYTFNLRPGIRYSTGVQVRASDVRRGVRRALYPGAARPDFYTGIVGGRACHDAPTSCDLRHGVVADDTQRRVTFHLVAPDPEFLWKLTMLVVPTPPGTPPGRLDSPLPSTGPYRVAAFRRSRTLTLTRNPHFREWSAAAQPAGFVDVIDWLKVRDARAEADAVRHGRADLSELNSVGGLDPVSLNRLVDRLRVSAPSRLHRSMRMGTGYVVVNSSLPPFDDVRVRRALNFAFDRTKVEELLGGPSSNHPTCQLLPPGMPSYRPYCPYTTGSPSGPYRGPDLARARALVRASGTRGTKVTVTEVAGLSDGPLDPYLVGVLRSLGYQASWRNLPDTPRNRERLYDPRSGVQVMTDGFFADYPLPSNFYDILTCAHSSVFSPSAFCDRDLDRRVAVATRMLQTAPGAALRAWTRIDRAFTDRAPLVPFSNYVIWWITSQRLGNYQNGGDTNGPLLSQLWVR